MYSYSYLDGKTKAVVTDIKVSSYEYNANDKYYEVDLQDEEVEVYDLEEVNADFDSTNVLKIDTSDKSDRLLEK